MNAAPIAAAVGTALGGLMIGNWLGKGIDKETYSNFKWFGDEGFFKQMDSGDIAQNYSDWWDGFKLMMSDFWGSIAESGSSDWKDPASVDYEKMWEDAWRGKDSKPLQAKPFEIEDTISRQMEAAAKAAESASENFELPSAGVSKVLDSIEILPGEVDASQVETALTDSLSEAQSAAVEKATTPDDAITRRVEATTQAIQSRAEQIGGVEDVISRQLSQLEQAQQSVDEKISSLESSCQKAGEIASKAGSGITEAGATMSEGLESVISDTEEGAERITSSIETVTSAAEEGTAEMVSSVTGGLEELNSEASAKAPEIVSSIKTPFEETDWNSVGLNISTGIAAGITSGTGAIKEAANAAALEAYNAARAALDEHSPSKKARDEVGLPFAEGLALGILDGRGLVEDAAESLSKGAVDKLKAGLTDKITSLGDTIKGQMDIFSKFDAGEAMSPDELLGNMESQIKGVQDWDVTGVQTCALPISLAARGLDQGLLKKLEGMGPQGARYVNSFAQMTNEQLQKANILFQQSELTPYIAAGQVVGGYAEAGLMAARGFSDGVEEGTEDAAAKAGQIGTTALERLKEVLDIQSPSHRMEEIGYWTVEGYNNGITNFLDEGILDETVIRMCEVVTKTIEETLPQERMIEYGYNMSSGIADGITNGSSLIEEALNNIAAMVESVVQRIMASIQSAAKAGSGSGSGGSGSSEGQSAEAHALGGIMTRPHMGLVAEDGAEAIIPLSGKRRNRGLALWEAAGRMLGVRQYAEGGVPDIPEPVPDNAGGGGRTVSVNISIDLSPEFNIEDGRDPERIMDMIRQNIGEVTNEAAHELALQFTQLFANMSVSGVG